MVSEDFFRRENPTEKRAGLSRRIRDVISLPAVPKSITAAFPKTDAGIIDFSVEKE